MNNLMSLLTWLTFIINLVQGILNFPGAIADVLYLLRISNKNKREE